MSAFDIGVIIWLICMTVVFCIFIIGLFITSEDYYSFTPKGRGIYNLIEFISIIALLVGVVVGVYLVNHKHKLAEQKVQESLQTAINNDYTFYLNGIEVEPDTVYLNDYTVHIDDEEQTVLMSCK